MRKDKEAEKKAKKDEFDAQVKMKEIDAKLEAERLNAIHTQKMQIESIKTLADTMKSAYKHDTAIKIDGSKLSQALNFIRGSVRPVLTYAYFIFFVWITIYLIVKFVEWYNLMPPQINDYEVLKDFYGIVISEWFRATLSTILGFWYGQR